MQPYFDPTKKMTSKKWKTTLKKMKMEDDLNFFFKLEWQPQKQSKTGRRPQERKMEDDLQKKMEDDLKKKGRRPQKNGRLLTQIL
jgi:hypothetical protein